MLFRMPPENSASQESLHEMSQAKKMQSSSISHLDSEVVTKALGIHRSALGILVHLSADLVVSCHQCHADGRLLEVIGLANLRMD